MANGYKKFGTSKTEREEITLVCMRVHRVYARTFSSSLSEYKRLLEEKRKRPKLKIENDVKVSELKGFEKRMPFFYKTEEEALNYLESLTFSELKELKKRLVEFDEDITEDRFIYNKMQNFIKSAKKIISDYDRSRPKRTGPKFDFSVPPESCGTGHKTSHHNLGF